MRLRRGGPASAGWAGLLLHWAAQCGAQELVVLRSSSPPGSGPPIVLAGSLALDCCSQYASFGILTRQSYELFIHFLTARGGISVGGVLRPLEIRIVNDMSVAASTTAAYQKHVSDGVNMLIAPYGSAPSALAANVANPAKVLLICPTASDTKVSQGKPLVFSVSPPAAKFVSGAFEALALNKAKTVSWVAENLSSQVSQCGSVGSAANASNMSLVYSKLLPVNPARNVTGAAVAELQQLSPPPDVVFGCFQLQACLDFADEALARSFAPGAIAFVVCMGQPAWIARGEAGLFFTGMTPWMSSMPLTSHLTNWTAAYFASLYFKTYNTDPPYQATAAFAALEALVVAIEKANTTDGVNVSAALRTLRLDSVYGKLQFDSNQQVSLGLKAVQPMQVGMPMPIVSPLADAQVPMRYPMPTAVERSCISQKQSIYGYNSLGVCGACSVGYTSVFNETAGRRTCFFCPPGFQYGGSGGQCSACPAGMITISAGQPECINCPRGTYAAAVGQSDCAACPLGTYADADGATACEVCQPGKYNSEVQQTLCRNCLAGTVSNFTGAVSCRVCDVGSYAKLEGMNFCEACSGGRITPELGSQSERSCTCAKDSYYEGDACQQCPSLYMTDGLGAVSKSACSLTSSGRVMIGIVVAAAVAIPCLIWAVWARLRQKIRSMENERMLALDHQIDLGLETLTEFQHPMVVVPASIFLTMSDQDVESAHEEARERGLLKTFDSVQHMTRYRDAHPAIKIVLFSYEWLSWVKKGPNTIQAAWMRRSLKDYCEKVGTDIKDAFVWLDVLSIPQVNRGVQILAVNSLYTYASQVDVMIIIAPPSMHEGTKEKANLESYKMRVWTRIEQVAHVAAHGLDSLYIATETELLYATPAWISDVVDVFGGHMTCCRLKHANRNSCDKETLVLPLLGLWYLLCGGTGASRRTSGADLLYGLIHARTNEIFPATFAFETANGVQQRPLFSDLIQLLGKHLRIQQAKPPQLRRQRTGPQAISSTEDVDTFFPEEPGSPTYDCRGHLDDDFGNEVVEV